jgi:hypothetical protein
VSHGFSSVLRSRQNLSDRSHSGRAPPRRLGVAPPVKSAAGRILRRPARRPQWTEQEQFLDSGLKTVPGLQKDCSVFVLPRSVS